jgi:hypothetical protein
MPDALGFNRSFGLTGPSDVGLFVSTTLYDISSFVGKGGGGGGGFELGSCTEGGGGGGGGFVDGRAAGIGGAPGALLLVSEPFPNLLGFAGFPGKGSDGADMIRWRCALCSLFQLLVK